MVRNKRFKPEIEPFRNDKSLKLEQDKVSGPLWFRNPTRAILTYIRRNETTSNAEGSTHPEGVAGNDLQGDASAQSIHFKWTSRNARKGRHAIIIRDSSDGRCPYATPAPTNSLKSIRCGIWRMFTVFIPTDISYLLAITFAAASFVLVTNAVLTFLPHAKPDFHFPKYIMYVEAVLTTIGCFGYLLGSFWAFTEAVNANRKGCYGWKIERTGFGESMDASIERGDIEVLVPDGSCNHHHDTCQVLSGQSKSWLLQDLDGAGIDKTRHLTSSAETVKAPWRWFPAAHELRSHMIYDIGFMTSCVLLSSSFVYSTAAIAALATTATTGVVARYIRIPQMVAAVGFTVSSALFALETQSAWLRPEPKAIGWHLSVWNTIGSLGFLLTAIFGFAESLPEAEFWFGCNFLWGTQGVFHFFYYYIESIFF